MRKKEEKMSQRTILIILFILVSVSCAHGPKAVITDSISDGGNIRWVHDPKTGLVIKPTFLDGDNYVDGIEGDLWICDGIIEVKDNPERSKDVECRAHIGSLQLFGLINPWYSCGNWACSFWP